MKIIKEKPITLYVRRYSSTNKETGESFEFLRVEGEVDLGVALPVELKIPDRINGLILGKYLEKEGK